MTVTLEIIATALMGLVGLRAFIGMLADELSIGETWAVAVGILVVLAAIWIH